MKKTLSRNAEELEDFVGTFSSYATLDEVHLVLRDWMRRPEWVCKHDGEYVPE
jgi:hypothetical protein